MSKAIVLLSGGQDSTTCLGWARAMFDEVHAVSVNYGQRHVTELEAAKEIAALAGVTSHEIIDGALLGQIGDSALVRMDREIKGEGGHIDVAMPQGLPTSFVPGRNLFFLTIVAAIAVKLGVKDIVTGVCQTDFSGYPDCRREFIDAFEACATLAMPSSAGPLRVHTPLMYLTKAETVKLAERLGCMPWLARSITCYHGKRPGCGTCPACDLRAKGFAEAGVKDPACP
jgi:7-cyano-7-deazaguanine synthase